MRCDVFNLSSGILPMLMFGGAATGPGGLRTFYKKNANYTKNGISLSIWLTRFFCGLRLLNPSVLQCSSSSRSLLLHFVGSGFVD